MVIYLLRDEDGEDSGVDHVNVRTLNVMNFSICVVVINGANTVITVVSKG